MSYKATATIGKEKYLTVISTGEHQLVSDEPESMGGRDKGPEPAKILSSALAACTSATLRAYADRKGWDLQKAIVEVEFDTNVKNIFSTSFTKKIELIGNLDDIQRKRLIEIAARCPLHKVLTNPIEISTEEILN